MHVAGLILKKYSWIVMLPIMACIVIVGVTTALTVYGAYHYHPPRITATVARSTDSSRETPGFEHYAKVVERDLFASGVAGFDEPAQLRPNPTPAASAPFRLKGTVVVNPEGSLAIIENQELNKQEFYRRDDVVNGYRLVRILRNKVVVEKDGREEVVEVVEEEVREAPAPPVQQPRRIQRRPVRRPVAIPPQNLPPGAPPTGQ